MNEIKVGNYVKLKNGHAGYIYKVTCAEDDAPRINVDFKQNVFSILAKAEVVKIDPKTAFLMELKALFGKDTFEDKEDEV